MARPFSRRAAIVAAVLGATAAAAATVSACGAAQAGASPSDAGPGQTGASPSDAGPGQTGASPSDAGPGQADASPGDATLAASPPTPAEVQRAQKQLDDRAEQAPSSVTSWGVDPAVGLVVVRVTGGRTPEVDRFLAGVDPRTLRVVTGSDPVRTLPAPS